MISEKFKNISTEDDTKILKRNEMKIEGYDVMYEQWVYEGIRGESYIFFNEDIKELSKEDILTLVSKKDVTYQVNDTYTFVNFGFEIV